ncbi:DNA polymerase/3'-5' exonuclease PolX [compost metagenome]
MRNADVARLLEDIAASLELRGDSPFRIRAYQDAARNVSLLDEDIATLHQEERLDEVPGVGPSISQKIAEYLDLGHSPYLEELIGEIPSGVFDLLRVPGIGPRKAKLLYDRLRVTSLSALAQAAREHRIREVPGMGAKTEANILQELDRLSQRNVRLPLYVAWPLAERVAHGLRVALDGGRGASGAALVEPAGSIRRRRETVGDIDLLVASDDPERVLRAVRDLPLTQEVVASGSTKITFLTREQVQVDVRIVPRESWGAALLYFTGSKAHNIALRDRAIAQGWKLNEYGLFDGRGKRLASETEEAVYAALGLEWIPPELREQSGEIELAAQHRLPRLLSERDVLGDFHLHSTYSDGRNTLRAMALAAKDRGYGFIVITDHSFGLGVAQGLTEAKAERQWHEIRDLNRELEPFRILRGVELEIRASGELDFPDAVLARFDWVGASLHTATRQPCEQLTRRLLGALADPYVASVNHPTGRIVGRRAEYPVDLEEVLHAAARLGKALEVNGSERMDLSSDGARRAKSLGVPIALSSDAHSVEGLDGMRMAVAIARRAGLGPSDVLNTLSPQRLLDRFGSPLRR